MRGDAGVPHIHALHCSETKGRVSLSEERRGRGESEGGAGRSSTHPYPRSHFRAPATHTCPAKSLLATMCNASPDTTAQAHVEAGAGKRQVHAQPAPQAGQEVGAAYIWVQANGTLGHGEHGAARAGKMKNRATRRAAARRRGGAERQPSKKSCGEDTVQHGQGLCMQPVALQEAQPSQPSHGEQ